MAVLQIRKSASPVACFDTIHLMLKDVMGYENKRVVFCLLAKKECIEYLTFMSRSKMTLGAVFLPARRVCSAHFVDIVCSS